VVFSLGSAAEPVGRNVTVTVRLKSPAGQHYLAVDRGSFQKDPLPSGAEVPPSQVRRTDDLLDVVQGFDRAALANLATTTRFTGDGLAGRGTPLNTSLAGLDVTAHRLTGILNAATPGDDTTGFLRGANLTAQGFAGTQPTDPGRLTTAAAQTFGAFASQRQSIAAGLQAFRPTEDELLGTLPTADATLAATTVFARRFTPAADALRRALPDLASLLGEGEVLRNESARLAAAGVPPLSRLAGPIRAFAPSAMMIGLAIAPLGPLARYLAQFGPELESGFAAFYAANNYLNAAGRARNTPAAPAMFIFTCATGSNTDPRPGQLFRDHLAKPCT
jgi:ABC-type transporter Mla subunit MlaD